MANSVYIHGSNPHNIQEGLRAMKLHAKVDKGKLAERPQIGVLFGRFEKQTIIDRGSQKVWRSPAKEAQVIWAHHEFAPFVHSDGRVRDASIVKIKSKKSNRTLKVLSAPTGDGGFIAHIETGIPQYWDFDKVAAFMRSIEGKPTFLHGSEPIVSRAADESGVEHVVASRLRWQRPRKTIPGTSDPFVPEKELRIYAGDAWLLYPGAELLVHDIAGNAFRVVCAKDGLRVVDAPTNPYDTFLSLRESRVKSYEKKEDAEELLAAEAAEQVVEAPIVTTEAPKKKFGLF